MMELQESRVFTLSFSYEEAKLLKEYLFDVDDSDCSVPAVVQAGRHLTSLLTNADL